MSTESEGQTRRGHLAAVEPPGRAERLAEARALVALADLGVPPAENLCAWAVGTLSAWDATGPDEWNVGRAMALADDAVAALDVHDVLVAFAGAEEVVARAFPFSADGPRDAEGDHGWPVSEAGWDHGTGALLVSPAHVLRTVLQRVAVAVIHHRYDPLYARTHARYDLGGRWPSQLVRSGDEVLP